MAFPLRIFAEKKRRGEPLAMVSLYDAPSAAICCEAGVDALLVGDSLGNVILGHENTIPVTMDDMLRHTAAVVRGVKSSSQPQTPVVADLPFGTYLGDGDSIERNGAALLQAGAHALKVEGAGTGVLRAIGLWHQMGAPVMGHLGYTPQSALVFQNVVQAKTANSAAYLLEDARKLEAAGCFAVVLEAVPAQVASKITESLHIPTIGIGAGARCSGQILVWHDLVGFNPGPPLRFVKRFADAHSVLAAATRDYVAEVQSGTFPATENAWAMSDDELTQWRLQDEDDIISASD